MSRSRQLLVLALAVILLAAAAAAAVLVGSAPRDAAARFHGTSYGAPEPAPDFTLTDHRGATVALDAFRGRVVLLFFGFTHCPDVCPLTLARLERVVAGLGRSTDEVEIVLITVDPERDTPAALAAYVAQFGPRVTGLTGGAEVLERVRREYGVYAERQAGHGAGHEMLVHTTAVFGIDRLGRLRVLLHADGDEAALAADVRTLLRL